MFYIYIYKNSVDMQCVRVRVFVCVCAHAQALTPWSIVLFEKLTGSQLVKKFPAFYGTWRFNTALTSACHFSLSWARSIQSMHPHPTSYRSILIFSSHLHLGLHSSLCPSGFLTKPHIHLSSPPYMLHALPISFFSILSPEQYWVRSTELNLLALEFYI
jgi:hypothetical protein